MDFGDLLSFTSEVEQTEYMESGSTGTQFGRFIGKATPPKVVLRRRFQPTAAGLLNWHQQARAGTAQAYRTCNLVMLSCPNAPVATYTLSNAWPSKYEILPRGGTAGAAAPEVLLE